MDQEKSGNPDSSRVFFALKMINVSKSNFLGFPVLLMSPRSTDFYTQRIF
jgi:hypothetical protein